MLIGSTGMFSAMAYPISWCTQPRMLDSGDDRHEDMGVGDVVLDLAGEPMARGKGGVEHGLKAVASRIEAMRPTRSASWWE